MNIAHNFRNQINYQLTMTLVADQIVIALRAQDSKSSRNFEKFLDRDELNDQLRRQFPSIKELFEFVGEEENFTVDPMNGKVILQIRRVKKKKVSIGKAEIVLEEVEEKRKRAEDGIESLQNMEVPSVGDQAVRLPKEDFEKKMQRRKEEWKKAEKEGIVFLNNEFEPSDYRYRQLKDQKSHKDEWYYPDRRVQVEWKNSLFNSLKEGSGKDKQLLQSINPGSSTLQQKAEKQHEIIKKHTKNAQKKQ